MIGLEDKIDKCIVDKKTQYLYSFDVFDTLITRRTPSPKDIFSIIRNILLNDTTYSVIPSFVIEGFCDYRIMSEQYQYSYNNYHNGYSDCSFDEIYQNFTDNFSLTETQISRLKQLELEIEYENLVPITKNINKLKDLVANGTRVVLISDMYHSSDTIRKWLLKFDSIFENIKIYVSNECKCKKYGGDLYKFVKEKEGIEYNNWVHFGDNATSDIEHAKNLGINAQKYEYPTLRSFQNFANDRSSYSISSLLSIGCSKNLKIDNINGNSKYDIGASLTAPILVPYIMWVLEESVKNEYKTLYFIARDGYFLKEIADFIIQGKNINIKTKYIYGSRLAWQGASFCVSLDNIDSVIKQYGINSEFLSKILDVEQKALVEFFRKYQYDKKNLDIQERDKLLAELKNNKDFISLIEEKNKLKCENLIGYLKQNIDFSEDKFAFVDLTGSGVTQNCLASVINQFDERPINAFYMRSGIYKVKPKNVNRHYYLLRNDACAMLELLARAPHGQTVGYRYDLSTKKYLPVLNETDEVKNWDYATYRQGIIAFTKEYLKLSDYKYFNATSSYLPTIYINWLVENIDAEMSKELGSVIFSNGGVCETEFAPQIKRRQAIMKSLGLKSIETNNYRMSYLRSKTSAKNILNFTKKYRSVWQWLFFIHISSKKRIATIRVLGIEVSFKKLLGMGEK
jgi:FMN phosphatase YigB (HAD superfamily)